MMKMLMNGIVIGDLTEELRSECAVDIHQPSKK
jgi:hypothetical protein